MQTRNYWTLATAAQFRSRAACFGSGNSHLASVKSLVWDSESNCFLSLSQSDLLAPMCIKGKFPCSLAQAEAMLDHVQELSQANIQIKAGERMILHGVSADMLHLIVLNCSKIDIISLSWQFCSQDRKVQEIVLKASLIFNLFSQIRKMSREQIRDKLRGL